MKKLNIISALIMGVMLISTPVYADIIIAKTTTELNVREQPNKEAEIIDVLSKDTRVEAYESGNPDWNKIKFDDYTGYVYNAYLVEEDTVIPFGKEEKEIFSPTVGKTVYSKEEFIYAGIINWNGWNWTYYTLSEWPGQTSTPVEGRYVNNTGFVCDPDGYVILASADLSPYTVVETPFGITGKVYDTGCPSGYLDVYVDW